MVKTGGYLTRKFGWVSVLALTVLGHLVFKDMFLTL